jgi:tRNA-2-methylthio-N6-dimethylallyladenosine synthase
VIDGNVKRIGQALVGRCRRSWSKAPSRKDANELMGRTECNRVVNFEGDARLVGQMIDLRITALAGVHAARRSADARVVAVARCCRSRRFGRARPPDGQAAIARGSFQQLLLFASC